MSFIQLFDLDWRIVLEKIVEGCKIEIGENKMEKRELIWKTQILSRYWSGRSCSYVGIGALPGLITTFAATKRRFSVFDSNLYLKLHRLTSSPSRHKSTEQYKRPRWKRKRDIREDARS